MRRACPKIRRMSALTTLAAVLCAAGPGGLVGAQQADPEGAPAVVLVESAEGSVEERPVEDLAREWLAGPGLALSFAVPPAAGEPGVDACTVRLRGGDRLLGRVQGGSGEEFELELLGAVAARISVDELVALEFPARIPAGRELAPAEDGDRLHWVRPAGLDTVDGTFEEFAPEGLMFQGRRLGALKLFPWEEIAALHLEPLGEAQPSAGDPAPGELPVVVDLLDGGRLHADLTALGADGALVELASGDSLALPLGVLAEIARADGSIDFLSARAPSSATSSSPFGDDLGLAWPMRVDRSVSGAPLAAGGRIYTRGFGVHSPSVLAFALDGTWRELRGSVALDDEVLLLPARSAASVEFRVWLDREPGDPAGPAWSSGVVRAGEAPRALEGVALEGVERLVLEVDMADNLTVGDRADWLRMLLVR